MSQTVAKPTTDTSADARTGPSPWRRLARRIWRGLINVFAVIGVLLTLYVTCFSVEVLETSSMAPTLRGRDESDPDWVLVERITYRLRKPRRWEIVAHRSPHGTPVMKRVIAFPGETVRFVPGAVEVDGVALVPPDNFPEFTPRSAGPMVLGRKVKVGFGYFVLGDYSVDSLDSRYLGPIEEESVTGRTVAIIWPPSRWRWLPPD